MEAGSAWLHRWIQPPIIVLLKVSSNNCSATVLKCFLEGVQEYVLPSRVRMDRGGENVEVVEYMLLHPDRGPGRGSTITGCSTHNQHIERLWRDLFVGCISYFYNLFYIAMSWRTSIYWILVSQKIYMLSI